MNVLVEEKCLKDIANAIRKKGEVTTTYKPREMAVAIDNLQTGGSGCLVKIEQSANQKITATYKGNTYTDEFFVLIGESFQTSITADKYYTAGTVNYDGKPLKGDITVRATAATEAPKYRVTIEQSDNQTITATWDGKTYTSTFYAYEGSRITFAVKANSDYKAGALNYTAISSLSGDITVKATQATEISYIGRQFRVMSFSYSFDGSIIFNCKFENSTEEFKIDTTNGVTIKNNAKFQQFLKNNSHTNFEDSRGVICTFKNSDEIKKYGYDYDKIQRIQKDAEFTITK